ncbi:MAG: glycosyltransferase [Clostridium sp.]
MSIYLIDNNECTMYGHNYIYRETLNSIDKTTIIHKVEDFDNILRKPVSGYKQRKNYVKSLKIKDVVHFLYVDTFYFVPSIFKELKKSGIKIIATLHWFPNKKLKEYLLKKSSKYIDVIVVHSEYIKNQLNEINIKNVEVVEYPAFNVPQINLKKEINLDKINVLCLGTTRYDKGLDIARDSFEFLSNIAKEELIFTFAGKEADIKYDKILSEAKKYDVNLNIDNKELSNEEYWNYIKNCDIVLLPYRKIFTGNSGPMTDGIYANKFILGPDGGNLGYLIEKYDLGATFKQENPKELANVLNSLDLNKIIKEHKYKEKITVNNFINSYSKIYNKLFD